MDAKEDFTQLKLRFTDPIQHDYEAIRPVVLFSQLLAERSRETEIERTTLGKKAKRFITEGMLGLVDQRTTRAGRKGHTYHTWPDEKWFFVLNRMLLANVLVSYLKEGRYT